jgi:hypothetical protein
MPNVLWAIGQPLMFVRPPPPPFFVLWISHDRKKAEQNWTHPAGDLAITGLRKKARKVPDIRTFMCMRMDMTIHQH